MYSNASIRLCLLLATMLLANLAIADERIVRFHSDISIAVDGTMTVTETIRVRAEGNNIRRGIYRQIPTRYRDRLGNTYNVRFSVVGLKRDGAPEPWDSHSYGNGIHIDFGDDSLLSVPAEYEYALTYQTSRQLGFFDDHDELYWNVTGLGWSFPIDQASATVILPQVVPAPQLAMEGYTGVFGARGQDYVASVSDGVGMIRTTRALPPQQGLTLVLSWPKGIVQAPTRVERTRDVMQDNTPLLLALLTLLANGFYLGAAWSKVGRDPKSGVVFPHYEPPADCTPAMACCVLRMGYPQEAMTAALVSLAVQGHLYIGQHGSKYWLERRGTAQPAAADERILHEKLFANGARLELDDKQHAVVSRASGAHAAQLQQATLGVHYFSNSGYLVPSAIGSVMMLVVVLGKSRPELLVVGVFAVIAVLHAVFGWLLKAPTVTGRALMDKIEGFGLYLDVAEKEEMNQRNPPELTPALFERYLPYAIALGLEQQWGARFEQALMAAGRPPPTAAYRPHWFGGHFNVAHIGDFTRAVGSNLNSAISSAATPPGSRSGSRGRGFSGGGGGGGGGGGR